MLNYITSEIYRSTIPKLIRILKIAGILIPVLVGFIFILNDYTVADITFLKFIEPFLLSGAFILGICLIVFIYKKEDSYKVILAQGFSRFQVILYDFISYIIILLFLSLLALGICLILELIISYYLGYIAFIELESFLNTYFWIFVGQISTSCFIFAITHITKSTAGGIILAYIITLLYPIIDGLYFPLGNIRLIKYFFPLNLFLVDLDIVTKELGIRVFLALVMHILASIYFGYLGFRKREF